MESDPQLEPFSDHLRYRFDQYRRVKADIEQAEGSLAKFAKVRTSPPLPRFPPPPAPRRWPPVHARVGRGGFPCAREATRVYLTPRVHSMMDESG